MDQIDRPKAERLRALIRGMGQMRHARRGDYLYGAGAPLSHPFMIEVGWPSGLEFPSDGCCRPRYSSDRHPATERAGLSGPI